MIRVCPEYNTDVSNNTCTIQQIYRISEDVSGLVDTRIM
jgi:hypothetical protein